MTKNLKIIPSGDSGILIRFGEKIDPLVSSEIHRYVDALRKRNISGLGDLVPGYSTLLVRFNPFEVEFEKLVEELRGLEATVDQHGAVQKRLVEIPTCYGNEYGPDLLELARHHNITETEVINLHTSVDYLVYFIGFSPGFPYMGQVSESIATPRLAQPRVRIPAGSVGIAGFQTGIYPIDSPGGWQLIGRTPIPLFNPVSNPPNLLQAGDSVRFVSITPEEFSAIQDDVTRGSFELRTSQV